MDCRCIIACFYLVQHTALHQRPVEDWYKFLNGLARHLHTLKNKCPSFPKLSIYRPLPNDEEKIKADRLKKIGRDIWHVIFFSMSNFNKMKHHRNNKSPEDRYWIGTGIG